ncbi:MAG: response regulator [Boseongicola sp.]|nr:response regulator [Boseongicola sp.]
MGNGNKKVLLVEDEDNIAFALGFLIERQGFTMSRVSSGPDALEAIMADIPDLVVLDVQLPGHSGYEVLQALREDARFRAVKVLMMSASGGEVVRKKCLALGANLFMMKPFSNVDLTKEISKLLGEDMDG